MDKIVNLKRHKTKVGDLSCDQMVQVVNWLTRVSRLFNWVDSYRVRF